MPRWNAVGTRVQSASAATLTPTKPTIASNTGGVLLAVLATKNNATHSTATPGWSLIAQINSGASFSASLWIAAESAANPVFTSAGAVACGAQVSHYFDLAGPMDVSVNASSNANGTANPHTSTSFNSTRADALAVYIDVAAANTALGTPVTWTQDRRPMLAGQFGARNSSARPALRLVRSV